MTISEVNCSKHIILHYQTMTNHTFVLLLAMILPLQFTGRKIPSITPLSTSLRETAMLDSS